MQVLIVTICNSVDDAISKGFTKEAVYKDAKKLDLKEAVVVKNGTQSGKSTVDLLFRDEDGNDYVCMVSSSLLKNIPSFD